MHRMTWRTGIMLGGLVAAGGARADDAALSAPPAVAPEAMKAAEPVRPAAPASDPAAASLAPAAGSATTALASAPPAAKAKSADATDAGLKGTVTIGGAKPADYPDLAKIQLQYAIRAAMTKVQGKLLGVELEPVNGFLVWNVEIVKSDKTVFAVKVDAGSGVVLTFARFEPGSDDE